MEQGLYFLNLIQSAISERGRIADYIEDALPLACSLPPEMSARDAADAFLRWFYGDPPLPQDQPVLDFLAKNRGPRKCAARRKGPRGISRRKR